MGLIRQCEAKRCPIATPERFARELTTKNFTIPSDAEAVRALYERTFHGTAGSCRTLKLNKAGWDSRSVALLLEALPHFTELEKLELSDNPISQGGEGGVQLLTALIE